MSVLGVLRNYYVTNKQFSKMVNLSRLWNKECQKIGGVHCLCPVFPYSVSKKYKPRRLMTRLQLIVEGIKSVIVEAEWLRQKEGKGERVLEK